MTQHSSELVTLKNYFLLKIINSILYAATTNHKICNCLKIHNSATFERKSADCRQEAHRAHHSPEKQFLPYTSLSEGIITVNEKKVKESLSPFWKKNGTLFVQIWFSLWPSDSGEIKYTCISDYATIITHLEKDVANHLNKLASPSP